MWSESRSRNYRAVAFDRRNIRLTDGTTSVEHKKAFEITFIHIVSNILYYYYIFVVDMLKNFTSFTREGKRRRPIPLSTPTRPAKYRIVVCPILSTVASAFFEFDSIEFQNVPAKKITDVKNYIKN